MLDLSCEISASRAWSAVSWSCLTSLRNSRESVLVFLSYSSCLSVFISWNLWVSCCVSSSSSLGMTGLFLLGTIFFLRLSTSTFNLLSSYFILLTSSLFCDLMACR